MALPHKLLKPNKAMPNKLFKPMALPHKLLKPNKAMPNKLLSHEATKLSLHMHIYTLNDEKVIKR